MISIICVLFLYILTLPEIIAKGNIPVTIANKTFAKVMSPKYKKD